ncbi:hypothetical protein CEXT_551691 [Caerostris extrusa]|uniref:Uncharacterized protein n=1 Tax=Caerostris extrusa TaxID=172846 RepID=A0AAV4SY65_CAEEX|nr:hypothetical protein CEXT_551691 [Caerostris extrusa]
MSHSEKFSSTIPPSLDGLVNSTECGHQLNFLNQALKVKKECAGLRSECFCNQRRCKSLSVSFGTFSPSEQQLDFNCVALLVSCGNKNHFSRIWMAKASFWFSKVNVPDNAHSL